MEDLRADGYDVFLLDLGVPDAVESHNTLETYCLEYIPRAVDAVLDTAQTQELSLFGYCFGAVLSLIALAADPELPVASVVLVATPVDLAPLGPIAYIMSEGRLEPEDLLDEIGNVSASTMLGGFRLMSPTSELYSLANLWASLADDRALAAHKAMTTWATDQIAFPGAVFGQFVCLFLRDRLPISGVVPLGGHEVRLSAIRCRLLNVLGDRDTLVPPESSAPLLDALAGLDVETLTLQAGHAGLLVGRQARKHCVPAILQWLAAS